MQPMEKKIAPSAKRIALALATAMLALTAALGLSACGGSGSSSDNKVLIYTSIEEFVIEDLNKRFAEEFPDYDITLEYMSTGNHAAKLLTEGAKTDCDITFDLEYTYMNQLDQAGVLANLSNSYDLSVFTEDTIKSDNYMPHIRSGGAIILNMDVINEKGLDIPNSYEDLLDPQYKGLISMPNPKSSGTGYMFYLSLVNAWGEEEALDYFAKLTPNVLQYTESGSGPINALKSKEVAIGLSMTSSAVVQINEGANFKILYFEEGSPYSMYGQGIIAGHEEKEAVKKVFGFLANTYVYEMGEKFYPEKIFKDKDFSTANYPTNIKYADMSNDTAETKEHLLSLWTF